MSIKRILVLGLAATALATVAWADDTYQCGESRCYDDQADETRRLNLMQLEDARAQNDADGTYTYYDDEDDDGDMNGQGGPYDPYDPGDDDGAYGDPDDVEPYGPADTYDDDYSDDDAPYPD